MGNSSPFQHGGDKPIQTDFTAFKPKSIAQSVSQAELQSHLSNLYKKQNSITAYRYHQDFDRIANQQSFYILDSSQSLQNIIKCSFFASLIFTRSYIRYIYHSQINYSLYKRYCIPLTFSFLAIGYIYYQGSQTNHVYNDNFYRELSEQQKKYRALDQHMDLYRYVDDIKYRFDYRKANIHETIRDFNKGYMAHYEKLLARPNKKIDSMQQQDIK